MGWRIQPVDVGEVAGHLADLTAAEPAGGVVEFSGPEALTAAGLARAWAGVRAPGVHVVATPVPGRMSSAVRDGAALPVGGARGRRSYGDHLEG
jgi:uncharacterized protein YbjT (DUF2867 family)